MRTLMKGDEGVKHVECLANDELLASAIRHLDIDVCKLIELENLRVLGVSLRRALVLGKQLGSSQ